MRTDTLTPSAPARFVVAFLGWSLLLAGVMRVEWVEQHVLLPLTNMQAALATALMGHATLPVFASLECSGADVISLCLGAILAFPSPWRQKCWGIVGGVTVILLINVIRIGSLGRAAASPDLFQLLHVFVWPAVLTVATGAYLLLWTRGLTPMTGAVTSQSATFVRWSIGLVPAFVLLMPLAADTRAVVTFTHLVAAGAAWGLTHLGSAATASANVLTTTIGPLLVTQECVTTPLIPVYLAAVIAYARTWPQRVAAAVATVPLFLLLGIARLLIVAVPDSFSASPLFFIHAFYQLLLGALIVAVLAVWQHGRRNALVPTAMGWLAAAVFLAVLGTTFTRVLTGIVGTPVDDAQGAVEFLPSFQTALFVALVVVGWRVLGWQRALVGLAALIVLQLATWPLLTLAAQAGLSVAIRDVRVWAAAAPLLLFLTVRRADATV